MDINEYKQDQKQRRVNTINRILSVMNGKMRVYEITKLSGVDHSVISNNLNEINGTHVSKDGNKWYKIKNEFALSEYDNLSNGSLPTKATLPNAVFISSDRHHHTPKPSKHTQVSIGSSFYMY